MTTMVRQTAESETHARSTPDKSTIERRPGQLPAESALLDQVRALAPAIAAAAEETERNRGMSPELMAKLKDAGLFRMMMPKDRGGEELNQLQAVRVIEEMAKADGSAGWNAMIMYGWNMAISRFPRSVLDKVFADGPDVVARGAFAPLGRAIPVEGGFRLSGQWPFASGSYEPQWILGCGIVFENGAPKMAANGRPEVRVGLLPASKARFLDTWYTVGMNGSASHDFVIEDEFVAEEYTANIFDPSIPASVEAPWLSLPFLAAAVPTHSAVVIGIAQGAIDEVALAARTKRSAFDPTMRLAEDPIFKHTLGQSAARLYALRAGLDRSIEDNAPYAESQAPLPNDVIAVNCALVAYTHAQCLDIINELFTLMGSTPVYSKSSLQRRWRDARVAGQHIGASQAAYGRLGALLVGEDSGVGFK